MHMQRTDGAGAGMAGRGRWSAGAVLAALALGQPGLAAAAPQGLAARVEPGAAVGVHGFKLVVEGGAPFGVAAVRLRSGAAAAAQALALDGAGAGAVVVRGWDPRVDVDVAVAALDVAGRRSSAGARARGDTALPPAAATNAYVVITEFMKDPVSVPDSAGEWIELHNRSMVPADIEGWTLLDGGSNVHTIHNGGAGVVIPAGGYLVLGNNDVLATNGGVHVGYRYSNYTLANGADEIRLVDAAGGVVDVVAYDDGVFWPDTPGRSISLSQDRTHPGDNDDPLSWCEGSSAMGLGSDLGTPGRPNGQCP